ncbi:unnamed protein product, partial [Rotaria socialis]
TEEDDNSVDEIFSCSSSSNQSDFSSVDDNQSDQDNDHESSQESDDELDEEESDQAPYYITHAKLKNTLTVVTKKELSRIRLKIAEIINVQETTRKGIDLLASNIHELDLSIEEFIFLGKALDH